MPTVLIVDDDDNQRLLYREELTMEGYDIIEASNGPDAIDLVAAQGVDCVVLDIAMPGMDGVEVMHRLHDHDRTLPIVLHSAYPVYKDDYMTWTADAYVVKSSDLSELKTRVARAIEAPGAAPPTP